MFRELVRKNKEISKLVKIEIINAPVNNRIKIKRRQELSGREASAKYRP